MRTAGSSFVRLAVLAVVCAFLRYERSVSICLSQPDEDIGSAPQYTCMCSNWCQRCNVTTGLDCCHLKWRAMLAQHHDRSSGTKFDASKRFLCWRLSVP